jgi:DNA-binding LytR/AlgR family response regulator
VNSTVLQSALREWTTLVRSPRLWATFAIVVAIFVATGPSGTLQEMGLAEGVAFWTLLHATTWAVAISINTIGEIAMRDHISNALTLLTINAVIATPFVAAAVELIRWSWLGLSPTALSYGSQFAVCLPLSILFSLLTHMTMSAAPTAPMSPQPALPSKAVSKAPPPLLSRLRPDIRAPILHLTVEDHYTVVTTTRGRQLVLLRFSDALRELGDIDGLQTHRSHWVATSHVEGVEKSGSRVVVKLKSGAIVPVSRSFAGAVQKRFPQV